MADLINRQTLAEEIESLTVTVAGKPARWYDAKHSVLQIIAEQAAVEVVRCKDCKRFSHCEEIEGVSWTGFCKYGEFHTDEDDFCSRGERRGDDAAE